MATGIKMLDTEKLCSTKGKAPKLLNLGAFLFTPGELLLAVTVVWLEFESSVKEGYKF